MKQRHTYGATSNILLDFRLRDGSDEYIHGDMLLRLPVFLSCGSTWWARTGSRRWWWSGTICMCTGETGTGARMEFTFMDADLSAGEHYYYVRVEQVDGHMAWASPIWVELR